MIVRDHKRRIGFLRDSLDLFFPFLQFCWFVEIVITIVAVVAVDAALKPMLVIAPVQPNISYSRCDVLGGTKRTPQQRLIDIAETDVVASEFGDRLRIIPALVPHLDHPRILDELPQQQFQIFAVQTRVLERNRKLNEQRAELAFRGQGIESLARQPFVLIIRTDAGRRRRLHHSQWRVGKRPVQLCRKKKIGIDRRCLPRPEAPQLGTYVSIKRSVDFDDIKELRQKFNRMDLLPRNFRWIQNSVPVLIRPPGSPYADSRRRFHTGAPDARRLAQGNVKESSPEGASDLSPALQRWEIGQTGFSPGGTTDFDTRSKANNLSTAESRSNTSRLDTPHCARSTTQPQTAERSGRAADAAPPVAAFLDGSAYRRLLFGCYRRQPADERPGDSLVPANTPPRQDGAASIGQVPEAPPVAAFQRRPGPRVSGSPARNRSAPRARSPGLRTVAPHSGKPRHRQH